MGHSRKHPYHPHGGNRKLTPLPPSDVLIHLLNLVPRAFVRGQGARRESPGLGRSILHSDWLTPYCLKITELDS
jgi:hypothetical protein